MKRLLQTLPLLLAAPSALGQTLIAQTNYPQPNDDYGSAMAAGDINGDSLEDLVVGAPDANGGAGLVLLEFSAVNLAVRVTLPPPAGAPAGFGTSIATADLNLDGRTDLVVGAPGGAGAVYVFLGQIGAQVPVLAWSKTGIGVDRFGTSVATTPDCDGDSIPEVIVGAPGGGFGGPGPGPCLLVPPGYVDLLSGLNGSVLAFHVPGSGTQCCQPDVICGGTDEFGALVAGGDLDGDGLGDVVVRSFLRYSPGFSLTWATNVTMFTYSNVANPPPGTPPGKLTNAKNVAVALVQNGSAARTSLAAAGDVNGDGMDDVLVGHKEDKAGFNGSVRVLQLVGNDLHDEVGDPGDRFGDLVVNLGDFSGSGRADFAGLAENGGQPYLRSLAGGDCNLGAPIDQVDVSTYVGAVSASVSLDFNGDGRRDVALVDDATGELRILSFVNPNSMLSSAGDELSLSEGGGGPLFITAGAQAQGGICFMVASGTLLAPGSGTLLDDGSELLFPLNDPWLTASLGSQSLLFANNLQQLDALGRATTSLEMCGIPSGLTDLHFGYFVIETVPGNVIFTNASNPVSYVVVP